MRTSVPTVTMPQTTVAFTAFLPFAQHRQKMMLYVSRTRHAHTRVHVFCEHALSTGRYSIRASWHNRVGMQHLQRSCLLPSESMSDASGTRALSQAFKSCLNMVKALEFAAVLPLCRTYFSRMLDVSAKLTSFRDCCETVNMQNMRVFTACCFFPQLTARAFCAVTRVHVFVDALRPFINSAPKSNSFRMSPKPCLFVEIKLYLVRPFINSALKSNGFRVSPKPCFFVEIQFLLSKTFHQQCSKE